MLTAPEAAALLDEFTPLALALAGRWGRRFPWLADDFASEAGYAVWRAALRFDPASAPIPFRSVVFVVVRRACARRVKSEYARNRAAFRTRPADPELDPLSLLADTRRDGTELADALGVLGAAAPDVRAALELHFLDGESYNAIGTARGVTGSAVRKQVENVVSKLQG